MNKKIRMIVSVAPLILVPLIKERKKIKNHPDMEKLSENSALLYGKARDKVSSATDTVKDASTTVADKTKDTKDYISEKYSDSRKKHHYKKEMNDYEKKLKKEEKLLKKYEDDIEKYRDKRLNDKVKELDTDLPTSKEKEKKMDVSQKNKKLDLDKPKTTNVRELNDQFVLGTEYEDDYSNGDLFMKHKNALDPRSAEMDRKRELPGSRVEEVNDSLFLKHRLRNEAHIDSHGRKTGDRTDYVKSDAHSAFDEYKAKFEKK